MIRINTNLFFWHPESKEFTQELSTLECNIEGVRRHELLDKVVNGFDLVSQRTGNVVRMRFVSTEYYGQGEDREVAGWHFVSTGPVAFGLVIIND